MALAHLGLAALLVCIGGALGDDDLSLVQQGLGVRRMSPMAQAMLEMTPPAKAARSVQHSSEHFQSSMKAVLKEFWQHTGEIFQNVTDMRLGLTNAAIVTAFDKLPAAANVTSIELSKQLQNLHEYMSKATEKSGSIRNMLNGVGQLELAENLDNLTDAVIEKLHPVQSALKKGIFALNLAKKETWLRKDLYDGRDQAIKEGIERIAQYRKEMNSAFQAVEAARGEFSSEVARALSLDLGSPPAVRSFNRTVFVALRHSREAIDKLLESGEVSLRKSEKIIQGARPKKDDKVEFNQFALENRLDLYTDHLEQVPVEKKEKEPRARKQHKEALEDLEAQARLLTEENLHLDDD